MVTIKARGIRLLTGFQEGRGPSITLAIDLPERKIEMKGKSKEKVTESIRDLP